MDIMVECLIAEIELQKNYLNEPIETIYFGGGTPSLLNEEQLITLISTIHTSFKVVKDVEITLEANPDDLNEEKMIAFNLAGINRLSIGIQSFDNDVLTFLNRAHNQKQAIASVELAMQVGIHNISVDLIYGIPNRSNELLKADLNQLIALNPTHISAYCLTIEPKTAFGAWSKTGKLTPVDDDFSAQQFEILVDELEKSGYEQYEISNFCKPNSYSRHNTAYWQQKPYLGIGPSAHSYNIISRQKNVGNNQKYIKAIQSGVLPNEVELLTENDKINDYLLTTLRTKWGADLKVLEKMNYSANPQYINKLKEAKKADITNNHLVLTKSGRLLADQISSDLFKVDNDEN